jgi:hypothetical protein
MRTITWRVSIEQGARTPYWNRNILPTAFGRLGRYFNVNFVQNIHQAQLNVVLTRNGKFTNGQPWAAWTSGWTIYTHGMFKWQSVSQGAIVFTHELGHVFGGTKHGRPQDVMAPTIQDIFRNFTQNDYWWFRSLSQKSVKAWNEPNFWRPHTGTFFPIPDMEAGLLDNPLICGHASWLDRIRGLMMKTQVMRVEE